MPLDCLHSTLRPPVNLPLYKMGKQRPCRCSVWMSLPHIAQCCLQGELLKLPCGQVHIRDTWKDRLSETRAQVHLLTSQLCNLEQVT